MLAEDAGLAVGIGKVDLRVNLDQGVAWTRRLPKLLQSEVIAERHVRGNLREIHSGGVTTVQRKNGASLDPNRWVTAVCPQEPPTSDLKECGGESKPREAQLRSQPATWVPFGMGPARGGERRHLPQQSPTQAAEPVCEVLQGTQSAEAQL